MEYGEIKPDLYIDINKQDIQGKPQEDMQEHFSKLLKARQDLFEDKLTSGLEKHMKFLELTQK
ncbi:MAG: hypothetical protein ACQESF_01945 [Nanobdellota archaeon]